MNPIDTKFVVSMLVVILLPPFIFVALNQTSYAIGLFLASGIVVIINFNTLLQLKIRSSTLTLILSLVFIVYISTLFVFLWSNDTKPIYSFFPLVFIIFSAIVFAQQVKKIEYIKLENSLFLIILILLFFGWLDFIYPIKSFNYVCHPITVFPFKEVSHYALVIGFLVVIYSITSNVRSSLLLILNLFIFAILQPSLLLLLFSLFSIFALLLRMRRLFFLLSFFTVPPVLVSLYFIVFSKIQYFADRLSFQNPTNLTTLVYFQGWELAFLNLEKTFGLGLGFQRLGLSGTEIGYYTDRIYNLHGLQLNLFDGSFLASKLIVEFGIFGILLSLAFISYFVYFIFSVNNYWQKSKQKNIKNENHKLLKHLLLSGIIFAFCLEYFFRGIGYFSSGLFLVIVACFSIDSLKMPDLNLFARKRNRYDEK